MPPPKKTTTRVNIVFMPYKKKTKSRSTHVEPTDSKEEKIRKITEFLRKVL